MANFDVSFLNPKLRSSGGGGAASYGVLVDQLEILESKLSSDGKLSPGDYDLLIDKAQELYGAPGMSASNRSNILVKIEKYKSQKSQGGLKDANNISALKDDVRDDQIKAVMLGANNPAGLLEINIDLALAKANRLKESADALMDAGDVSASSYILEYNEAVNEYNDLVDIRNQLKTRAPGKPVPGYAAYITTNARGEVTDVKFAAAGSISGYAETTGIYGGLQIYGKARRENGKLVFKLGKESFSAADVALPDPMNPGAFKTTTLTADSQKTSAGRMSKSVAGQFLEVDTKTVRSQTSVPVGTYAQGSKGFYYKALEDGTYQKIVNATPEKLGISDDDVLRLPRAMENTAVIPRVSTTTDYSMAPITPLPTTINAGSPSPVTDAASTTPAQQNEEQAARAGTSRTPSPTERAPSGIKGYAQKAVGAAKGFFAGLFGK